MRFRSVEVIYINKLASDTSKMDYLGEMCLDVHRSRLVFTWT